MQQVSKCEAVGCKKVATHNIHGRLLCVEHYEYYLCNVIIQDRNMKDKEFEGKNSNTLISCKRKAQENGKKGVLLYEIK